MIKKIIYFATIIILLNLFFSLPSSITFNGAYFLTSFLSQFFFLDIFFYKIIIVISVILSLILIKVDSRKISFFLFFLYLIIFSLSNSQAKVSHDSFVICYTLFFAIFLPADIRGEKNKTLLVVGLLQATHLSIYFNSGLWKVRGLMNAEDFHFALFQGAPYTLAHAIGEGATSLKSIWPIFKFGHFMILKVGYFFVLLFQLLSFLPLFRPTLMIWWGVMAFMFHLLNGVILGIWFYKTMLFVLVNFIFIELYLKKLKGERPKIICSQGVKYP